MLIGIEILPDNVADPDPYVFGPPGSASAHPDPLVSCTDPAPDGDDLG